MMNQVLSKVDNVISNRQTKESLPQDSALSSLSVTIANTMQDVPKDKRRKCLVKIFQVIEEFIE